MQTPVECAINIELCVISLNPFKIAHRINAEWHSEAIVEQNMELALLQ
jgi:hypothetical protein